MTPYLRRFDGDADRPALALHCMLGSGAMWEPIARHLDGRVALTSFDMPGHGRTPDLPDAPDSPDYHTAVTRMAAAQITRPVDLIGHSFGATVALRLAVGAPHAVRSLTLIEPVLFAATAQRDDAGWSQLQAAAEAGDWHGAAEMFTGFWGGMPWDALPQPARDQIARQMRIVLQTEAPLVQDSGRILREGGLEGIDAPVLLIAGEDTQPIIHDIHAALADRLEDVGRATIPGAGHMSPLTHPREVAGLIAVNLDRA